MLTFSCISEFKARHQISFLLSSVSIKRINRSSHQRCSMKKGFLRNFTMSKACNFIKKEALAQVISYEFCEISKNNIFTQHFWATASVSSNFYSLSFPIIKF